MGFSPADVDRWAPWQFAAAWKGWKAANCLPETASPSPAEHRAALAADRARTVH